MSKGYSPPDPDSLAVYHILQLAEQGRPGEHIAQFLASWFVSGEMEAANIVDETDLIRERVIDLCMHPEWIWDGLLPGGPGNKENMFATLGLEYFGHLEQAETKLIALEAAFRTNYDTKDNLEDYLQRLEAIGHVLNGTQPTQPTDSTVDDEFIYTYSIIINPSVRHDELSDLIRDAVHVPDTSPLNLAGEVKTAMDIIDRTNRWPAEELAAWITHAQTDQHWLMTWDQASAILLLEETQQKLESLSADYNLDWDEQFQGIADMMAMAGNEYAAGR